MRILLDLAGLDEREKLLVEDKEWLELDLALAERQQPAAGADREHVIAGMRKTAAQFFRRGSRLHLLKHVPVLVGQFDDKLSHICD